MVIEPKLGITLAAARSAPNICPNCVELGKYSYLGITTRTE
jgi:hypothetical protein